MTTQQAYEAIRAYFSKPGAVLAKGGSFGMCAYKVGGFGPEAGAKCAVGCLIPDEAYTPEMEGQGLNPGWLDRFPFVAGLLYGVDKSFLRAAQLLHDSVAQDADKFVQALDVLAAAHGLENANYCLADDPLLYPAKAPEKKASAGFIVGSATVTIKPADLYASGPLSSGGGY